jgi:hypothetical protein
VIAGTARPQRFILAAIDPATECPAAEVSFNVDDLADLRAIVGVLATDQDFHVG